AAHAAGAGSSARTIPAAIHARDFEHPIVIFHLTLITFSTPPPHEASPPRIFKALENVETRFPILTASVTRAGWPHRLGGVYADHGPLRTAGRVGGGAAETARGLSRDTDSRGAAPAARSRGRYEPARR